MLPLRLGVFAGLTAVALWGLFSLLENLRLPALLRSSQAVIVKGCDPIESDEARTLCPQFFCQKALLDAQTFPLKTTFETTVDRRAANQHLIGGRAHTDAASASEFACLLQDAKVVSARALDVGRLAELAAQSEAWSLDEARE